MNVTETKGEGMIQLAVSGNVDTNTAPRLQSAVLTAFQKTSNVVLDMGQCPYLSSAGLRALLIGQKTASSKGGTFRLCNVQESVMKVLQMTKFDKVLTVDNVL